jgi:hypothetical protein
VKICHEKYYSHCYALPLSFIIIVITQEDMGNSFLFNPVLAARYSIPNTVKTPFQLFSGLVRLSTEPQLTQLNKHNPYLNLLPIKKKPL